MNDAEKLRSLADLAETAMSVGGLMPDQSEIEDIRAIAARIEKLERLVREMSEDCIFWDDNEEFCYCVFCRSEADFEDRVAHADDCQVEVARRWGIIK